MRECQNAKCQRPTPRADRHPASTMSARKRAPRTFQKSSKAPREPEIRNNLKVPRDLNNSGAST
eukprot:17092-Pyramimonas_sp.AAC.1